VHVFEKHPSDGDAPVDWKLVTCEAGVTTNAVAERAGVSIGSLYQYFASKEAIFQALQRRHRDQVMPLIQHALAHMTDPSLDMVDAIVMLMRAMLELHDGSPARLRALEHELHEHAAPEDLDAFVEHTAALLAVRAGRPPARLRATAWLACLTLTHAGRALVHDPPDVDREDLFDGLTRLLHGLFASRRMPRHGWSSGATSAANDAADPRFAKIDSRCEP
jgi:AcrR family transcriptional regulator